MLHPAIRALPGGRSLLRRLRSISAASTATASAKQLLGRDAGTGEKRLVPHPPGLYHLRGMTRLSVNVDHVATLRQARRATVPDPVEFALESERAGAAGITVHLRADRRHIQDDDLKRLRRAIGTQLNLEVSLAAPMLAVAERSGADSFCLVPEHRQEITTEGGLDVCAERLRIARAVRRLQKLGATVTLFVDPDLDQIQAAADAGAHCVEIHTGPWANSRASTRERARILRAAQRAHELGLEVHAGHGLDYANVHPIASVPHVEELAIGHSIVARAVLLGFDRAVAEMVSVLRNP